MTISKKKFIALFIVAGFLFLAITTTLLGTTGPRGFPKAPDSLVYTGGDAPVAWKRVVATLILPAKAVLLGPIVLPQVEFLKDDPPPFVGLYLMLYWTILASIIHSLFKWTEKVHCSSSA